MKRNYIHGAYIWQRPDWPAFRWDMDKLAATMLELVHLHGQLAGRMSMLGLGDKSNAHLQALTDELTNSSDIEGVVLNAASVRSSIARRLGMDNDGLLSEDYYVEGLVDVMLDAIYSSDKLLSADRLFGWHCALFPNGRSGMYSITVGGWRIGDEPMRVVSGSLGHEKIHYEAPPSSLVPAEMTRFLKWCSDSRQPPLIKAAVAHLWFVTIHPFDDGNGRLSRTLADMFLSELDGCGRTRYYSMSAEINRNKKSYYDILERTQKGGLDITEWMLWFFERLKNAIIRTMDTVSRTLAKTAYWNCFSATDVNERQRKVINRLWDGFDGKLTSSKWAKICGCSQDTALRDINDLLSKGMLRDSGEGGRSTNYILVENASSKA